MKIKKTFILIFLINLIFSNLTFSQDVPIIVISPGKTPQSYDKVGSSISVIDSNEIKNSPNFFISDIIGNNSTNTNMFQMGGHGTNTGIQLRGLEKRYSTVYIDGVKMSDPSSSDNSFYIENIMKSCGLIEADTSNEEYFDNYGDTQNEGLLRSMTEFRI